MTLFLAQTADDTWTGSYELGWFLEPWVFLVCAAVSIFGFLRYFPLTLHGLFAKAPNPGLGLVRGSLLFAAFWFWFVLAFGAASDVLGFYTLGYSFMSVAALLAGGFWRPMLGLYYVADVLERGNFAASLVFAGFALGTAFAFGGALTGEGPGWWVVVVFFLLAYLELRWNMSLVSRFAGHLAEDVRLERDASAGLLLGAIAMSSGLVSGRAAAGDFLGWGHALGDYALRLWPLLVIAGAGSLAGLYSRHSEPAKKLRTRALASALLVAGGFLYYFLT